MSRDVGNFMEVKATIKSLESRESGSEQMESMGPLDTPYKGGKVHVTAKDFAKPKGMMRKHLE